MNKHLTQTGSSAQFKGVNDFFKTSPLYAVLLFVLCLGFQQNAFAQSTPPAIPNTSYLGAYNNCHYYKVTTSDVTNAAAASTCFSYGGRLPKITSSAHNTWLKGKVNGKCWLGLDNAHVTNTWCYHDISTPSYTNWGTGVFTWITSWFGLSTVNYSYIDLDGFWKNCDSYQKAWCVIEVPYTPTTTTTSTCVCTPPTVPNCTFLGTYDNAHYYKSNKGDLDSYQANALCKEYGGRLPRIKSSTHNTWLKGVCGGGYWLGHHKLTGTWKYQDGVTALGYANWNVSIGSDAYAKCEIDGSWKSCNIFAKTKCIIEIPCTATAQPLIDQYISVDNGTYAKTNTVTVCSGQTVRLDLAAAYPTTWKFVYTRPDGTTFPGGTNGVENDQIQFQVATSGTNLVNKGTWKVTYTNPNGCSNTASFIVNATATTVAINNTPANINLIASSCGTATWAAPTATSTCGTPTLTSNFASGYCFPIGTTTVIYTATLNGVTTTSSFTVTVAAPAALPIAKDDNATVPPNTPITITPLSNDVVNGTFQSIAIKSQPANGSVVLNGNDFVFTPDAGFFGTTTFTYCFTTSNGTSNTATVTVVVPRPAPLPIAEDDNATTPQNTAVTITPLSNDVVNGTFQTIAIKSQPANGSVVLSGNNFVFTPATGFFGTTTFTYCFTTTNGTSNTATVTVVIPAPAPLPIAKDDNATTAQNTAVTITPLSNDVVNGTFQTIAIKSQPANGSVVLSGSNFVFTPANGFSGTTTFTYCFTTTNGTSNTATVTVVIPAPAQLPVAVDDNATTPQNTAVTITPLSNDAVNGTFQSIAIKAQSANGSVVLSGNNFVFTPATGFSGTTTFTYCFTTSNGTSNTATVTVVVPQAVINCNEIRNNAISTTCVNGAPVLVGTVLPGYEYQWLSSTSVCPNGPSQAIAGATNADLVLPSVVAQNTNFMRCARPIGCTTWEAVTESNCLTVTPTDCAAVVLVGCDAVNAIGNSNGTIGVAGMGNFTSQILVFNSQWQPISNQTYSVPATTIPVKNGNYIVKVQLYNTIGGWNFVCEKQFNVTVSGGLALLGNTPILELSAKAEMRQVQLGWANNTGDKTDYFEVEKLNNVTGSFEPLTWVNAKHTNSLEYYTAKDEQPTEGDNTYRVNVTTYDGITKVSNTSTIKYSKVNDFRAFPNPANSTVSVDLTNYKNQATEVYLYNYLGQVSQVIKSENVTNTIVEFDVTNEPVGQYSIRVVSKGKRDVVKQLVIAH